jgi:hypothetical protein
MNVAWTDQLVSTMLSELLALDASYWHYNEFRNCNMLSIFNPGGRLGKVDLGVKSEFEFTDAAAHCPTMVKFLTDQVLWWMEPPGRVTILRTPPGYDMPVHLDCSLEESGTIQHKWRFVIKGDIEKLFFLDQDLNKVYAPVENRCYVIDGGHPHRIEVSDTEKITICIGSPWKGDSLNSDYVSRLNLGSALYVTRPEIKDEWVDSILKK